MAGFQYLSRKNGREKQDDAEARLYDSHRSDELDDDDERSAKMSERSFPGCRCSYGTKQGHSVR